MLAYQNIGTCVCKKLVGEFPQDCPIIQFPKTFLLEELISTLSKKPVIVDGESLFFSTVEDGIIMLKNDFNKRLTRGCIALWP